jgi:hypothetical protein
MSIKSVILTLLLCATTEAIKAQERMDTVITYSGYTYVGRVTKIIMNTSLDILTADSVNHQLPYSSVKLLILVNIPVEKPSTPVSRPAAPPILNYANQAYTPLWSTPHMPQYIKTRRDIGIGLAIGGSAIIATGIGMVLAAASNPFNSSSRTLVNVGFLGGLFIGTPVMIVGIVVSHRAHKEAERFARSVRNQ